MKRYLSLLFLAALAFPAFAQHPPADAAERTAAMQKLASLHGTWKGTAKGNMRGAAIDLIQTERIGPMLDGDVLVIEGRGYKADGGLDFNALAIISYDTPKDTYQFRSYANGYAGTYEFRVTDTGYSWEMPADPGASIRHDIQIKDSTWLESSYYIKEGAEPVKFLELKLERVGDTEWPAAGFIK